MGTIRKLIFSSDPGSALNADGSVSIKLKITRNDRGDWKIYADKEGGNNLVVLGEFNESSFRTTKYFGIHVKFSSTKNQSYFFDNFTIKKVDYTAPTVANTSLIDVNKVQLYFSENVTSSSASKIQNYKLSPDIGVPRQVQFDGNRTTLLTFQKPLQENIII